MHMIGFWALLSLLMLSGCEHEFALSEQVGKEEVFSEKYSWRFSPVLIRTISRQQKDLWMRVRWVRTHGCLFSKGKGLTLLLWKPCKPLN